MFRHGEGLASAGDHGSTGGDGAASGGGAGGLSVGAVGAGSAPAVDSATDYDIGAPGLGGAEVTGVSGTGGLAGQRDESMEAEE
jgi:hypothetical protein